MASIFGDLTVPGVNLPAVGQAATSVIAPLATYQAHREERKERTNLLQMQMEREEKKQLMEAGNHINTVLSNLAPKADNVKELYDGIVSRLDPKVRPYVLDLSAFTSKQKSKEDLIGIPAGGLYDAKTGKVVVEGEPKEKSFEKEAYNEWLSTNPGGTRIDFLKEKKAETTIVMPQGSDFDKAFKEAQKENPSLTRVQFKREQWEKPNSDMPLKREADKLRKEFTQLPEVKNATDVKQKYDVMNEAMKESKTTGNFVAVDQAIITLFNKMTDPQSVVRESEYARTAQDLALWNRIKGKVSKWQSGGAGLTQEDRQAIFDMAGKFQKVYQAKYKERLHEYKGYMSNYVDNPDDFLSRGLGEEGTQKPKTAEEYLKKLGGK